MYFRFFSEKETLSFQGYLIWAVHALARPVSRADDHGLIRGTKSPFDYKVTQSSCVRIVRAGASIQNLEKIAHVLYLKI